MRASLIGSNMLLCIPIKFLLSLLISYTKIIIIIIIIKLIVGMVLSLNLSGSS